MTKGAVCWNDKNRYYSQRNNAIEQILAKYNAKVARVTCGPTAAVTCLDVMDHGVSVWCPGPWEPQPEDVLTLWFHDQRNWDRLKEIRPKTSPRTTNISPNEVPQYYPEAIAKVFDVDVAFEWIKDFDRIASIVAGGNAVMLTLPGHYVSVIAYDTDADALIYHDSNKAPFLRMDRDLYATCGPYALIFKGRLDE